MSCQEVRTPPFLLSIHPQILQCINSRRQHRVGPRLLVLLEELARGHVRVGRGGGPDPAGCESPATGVDGVPVLGGENPRVDAEVLAGGEADGEDLGAIAEMGGLVGVEELELGEGLLHLVDGAGAVEELDGVMGLGEDVAGDEGEEGDGLAGACGHFEKAVTLGVQGSLEFQHVGVLLWVYVVVGEVHCYVLHLKLHGFWGFQSNGEGERKREGKEVWGRVWQSWLISGALVLQ